MTLMEGTRRRMLLAVFCAFVVSACSNATPSLGRGLPRTFVPTADFDRRIKEHFPVGSEESKLLAELHGERFKTTETQDPSRPYRFSALYVVRSIACRESWKIQWNAEQGRIVGIEGWYSGEICL
jgi:hypothetical protein